MSRAQEVNIPAGDVELEGVLVVPPRCDGLVVFAHGSGSSRHSPRNRFVASALQREGLGTLLFDLLTVDEDRDYARRFEIAPLTERLVKALEWALQDPALANYPFGLFGSSTGAAAALAAAAEMDDFVDGVVSRGGRPDLAGAALAEVRCPTLLIVGGNDAPVIPLNERALELLGSREKKLEIIPGATHLFSEPGALEEVSRLAARWFRACFTHPSDFMRGWASL